MKSIFRDPQFYLCLGLGPVSWLLMSTIYPARQDLGIPPIAWFQLSLIILIYPVLEEIVFRGLLLEYLSRRFSRRFGLLTIANLLTSFAFVAAHLFYSPWLWALLVFFPSLVFGYLKERHQSLLSPILIHGFYNFGYVWFFWT